MVFGTSDVAAALLGLGAYAGSLHARGLLGAALDTSAVASPLWLAAAAAVAYSHLLYASVWFSPAAFVRLCARPRSTSRQQRGRPCALSSLRVNI